MNVLKDKVVIITGANSGIGQAAAHLFADQGAKLVVTASDQQRLDILVKELKQKEVQVVACVGDVTDEKHHKKLVDLALQHFGKLDAAFNNAGILGEAKAVTEITLQAWEDVLKTNLTSCFLAAKYQIPALKRHAGSLIFTSSFVGNTVSFPYQAAYAASKAGIVGLTKTLALECADEGVRVNALLPGGTDTPIAKDFAKSEDVIQYVKNIHALKRMAQPEEIAQAALFLASNQASFITGSAMLVDGGVSIQK